MSMYVVINSPEYTNQAYTSYAGRILSVETLVGTSVQGITTNSVFNGKELSIRSTSAEYQKARVTLANGRIREFHTDGVEMQEGDEVEFISSENGSNVYVKNVTTRDWDIAEPRYNRSEIPPVSGMACMLSIAYGGYSVYKFKSFMVGFGCILVGAVALALMIKFERAWVRKLRFKFEEKVRATGTQVASFKEVNGYASYTRAQI